MTYTCDKTLVSCGCSYNDVHLTQSRIVGGEEAIPHSWSFVVSLQHRSPNSHFCGGSIFSDSYILTAAHCVDDETPYRIQIVAGVHNRSDPNNTIREVDHIHIHPDWSPSSRERRHDIAMLHLSQPLRLASNPLLTRICLPNVQWPNNIETYPSNGTRLATIGWGNIKESFFDNSPDNLHQVQVFTIDNNDPICNKSIFDTQVQFCAALHEGGKDTCQGDSGGPILQWLGDRWEQVGITSFGKGCAVKGDPGIYTRLAYYSDWMESVTDASSNVSTPLPHAVYQCDRTSTCGCGQNDVPALSSRIVGGEDAVEASWSMMVSLRFPEEFHQCGGTLLSESFILTAAYCVDNLSIGSEINITVAVGMTNRSDPRQIIREVDRIYIHPNYSSQARDYRHDIALLHVKTPFIYTNYPFLAKSCIHRIDPPELTIQHPRNGSHLTVIGWGFLKQIGSVVPEMLQQVHVYTIGNDHPACLDSIYDPQLQFCAGIIEGGKDSCLGDSGGPIFQWTGRYWEQVGIVSNVKGCGDPGRPGIYTRLSYYYHWVNDILQSQGEHLEPLNQTTRPSSTMSTAVQRTTSRNTQPTRTQSTTVVTCPFPTTNTSHGNKNYQYLRAVGITVFIVHALSLYYSEF
ncbi:unnamed protein product [Rotaria socialis]|uniref:Peptidase S1 domain-containing protein n=1 Tax=Rotaria socialis TaxID=392032 RepID=A0A818IUN3_9BILA|nr:unnamed protein product [Rotaria socialis]